MSVTTPQQQQDDKKNYAFVVTNAHNLVLRHVPVSTSAPVTLIIPQEVSESMQQFLSLRQAVFNECGTNNPKASMALRDHLTTTSPYAQKSSSNN